MSVRRLLACLLNPGVAGWLSVALLALVGAFWSHAPTANESANAAKANRDLMLKLLVPLEE
jgi:hypothetical protein